MGGDGHICRRASMQLSKSISFSQCPFLMFGLIYTSWGVKTTKGWPMSRSFTFFGSRPSTSLQQKGRMPGRVPVKRGANHWENGCSGNPLYQKQKVEEAGRSSETNRLPHLLWPGKANGQVAASVLDLLHAMKQTFAGSGACGHRRAVCRIG